MKKLHNNFTFIMYFIILVVLITELNINHDVCGRPTPSSAGCNSTFFSTYYNNHLTLSLNF